MTDKQELATFGNTGVPANPDDLVSGLQSVTAGISSSGTNMLMRLLKTGVYAYGQENIEPEAGSLWAINPYSIQHGFACWAPGELLGEAMVPFNQMPPAINTLPDYGHSWDQQISMQMKCMTGEDKGTEVTYKGTSVGYRNAAKAIINDIIAQASNDPDHIVPVVDLEVDSYKHKDYGQVFVPVLEIQEWVSIADGSEAESEEPEPEAAKAEEKPQRRRRRRA